MTEKNGVARLRQAIENQASVGEASFSMPFDEASALLRECEDELARLAWAAGVPAPVDADGKVVPLTTEAMYGDSGEELTVRLICYRQSDGGWVAELYRPCATIKDTLIKFHLSRPDSWEKLEEDVEQFEDGGTACEYFGGELTGCNECKSPCSIGANCRNSVAHDVLRRAKALAERDAKEA